MTAEPLVALPTLADVRAAAARLAGVAVRTPLVRFDDELAVKPESLQPVGSFKLRGAYNCIAALPPDVRARGVVAHSSGNHAQAVAFAARTLGVPATVVMPDDAPEIKRVATARWGAEIVVVGPGSDERATRCAELAAERGLAVVAPYDDHEVVAGQGTVGLEIVEDAPAVDLVLVPVSGGGLLAGVAVAVKALAPSCAVVAVEPALADDAWQSVRSGTRVSITAAEAARTSADGLRVQRVGDRGWAALRTLVDDVVRVAEDEILDAVQALASTARVLAEPSGAVTTAAWVHHRAELPAARVAVAVVSGGNAAHRVQIEG